jgi:hypothetical protein
MGFIGLMYYRGSEVSSWRLWRRSVGSGKRRQRQGAKNGKG